MWQESALKLKETVIKVHAWSVISRNGSVAAQQLYSESSAFFLFFYMVKSFAL